MLKGRQVLVVAEQPQPMSTHLEVLQLGTCPSPHCFAAEFHPTRPKGLLVIFLFALENLHLAPVKALSDEEFGHRFVHKDIIFLWYVINKGNLSLISKKARSLRG